MNEKYEIKPEQAQVLEELETLLGEPLPIVTQFTNTFGVKIEGNNVVGLGLSRQGLLILPKSIGNLSSLKVLYLYSNQLTTLPESIGNLSSLKKLWLYMNQLTSLPESIGNLSSLKELWLYDNQLKTLPESIGKLNSLESLLLEINQLSTLPESMTKLTSLKDLYLDKNQLTILPESMGNLKSLEILRLRRNQLSTLPESMGNLFSLQTLDLSVNKLTTLPKSFSQLRGLQEINLRYNNWKGEWADIAKKDLPTILTLCQKLHGMVIFISHAMNDEKIYHILELSQFLEENILVRENGMDMNIIHDVVICEEDLIEDIWEFMTENVPKSQLLVFIATRNSLASEACRYELFLASENGIEIIPIKGTAISWEALKKIELINRNKHSQGYLDLSNPKERFEFDGNNFDEICEKLSNYIKTHESDLKKSKKESEQLEIIQKDIIDALYSKEFGDVLKEHINDFEMIFQETSDDEITSFEYMLKLEQIIKEKEKK